MRHQDIGALLGRLARHGRRLSVRTAQRKEQPSCGPDDCAAPQEETTVAAELRVLAALLEAGRRELP